MENINNNTPPQIDEFRGPIPNSSAEAGLDKVATRGGISPSEVGSMADSPYPGVYVMEVDPETRESYFDF